MKCSKVIWAESHFLLAKWSEKLLVQSFAENGIGTNDTLSLMALIFSWRIEGWVMFRESPLLKLVNPWFLFWWDVYIKRFIICFVLDKKIFLIKSQITSDRNDMVHSCTHLSKMQLLNNVNGLKMIQDVFGDISQFFGGT
jgi:hypothetical protein